MLIRSRDGKTVLSAGEVAGVEVTRGRVYPPGEERWTAGFMISAILMRYDGRIQLGAYESEGEAVSALDALAEWLELGGKGVFQVT